MRTDRDNSAVLQFSNAQVDVLQYKCCQETMPRSFAKKNAASTGEDESCRLQPKDPCNEVPSASSRDVYDRGRSLMARRAASGPSIEADNRMKRALMSAFDRRSIRRIES